MSRLIIAKMEIAGRACLVCALQEEKKIMELQLRAKEAASILNNIYVGRVESISSNISAAFVRFSEKEIGYFSLEEAPKVIYTSGRKGGGPLRVGDEILVQVRRDAMKGKLPALSANLNFAGRFLVLTSGDKCFGLSGKLSREEKNTLSGWLREEASDESREYGLVVRTNAARASKEELFQELAYLKGVYEKVVGQGKNRVCFSLLYENPPFYLAAVRDTKSRDLEEIVTDDPRIAETVSAYFSRVSPEEQKKVRFYEDKLLPLYKLYRLETAIDEIRKERIWLDSGGFLVIQQTEAFVCIDVNSGKYIGKKKAEETYRMINLEAAEEIARQLRLRNLSGIILVDFINMESSDHQDELFHVLQKHLRRDTVKAAAVDITPLHILEMTRQKTRRPVIEDIRELENES